MQEIKRSSRKWSDHFFASLYQFCTKVLISLETQKHQILNRKGQENFRKIRRKLIKKFREEKYEMRRLMVIKSHGKEGGIKKIKIWNEWNESVTHLAGRFIVQSVKNKYLADQNQNDNHPFRDESTKISSYSYRIISYVKSISSIRIVLLFLFSPQKGDSVSLFHYHLLLSYYSPLIFTHQIPKSSCFELFPIWIFWHPFYSFVSNSNFRRNCTNFVH